MTNESRWEKSPPLPRAAQGCGLHWVLDEELQRQQLTTSLHDGGGQKLALTRIKLGLLRASLSQSEALAPLNDLRETLDETKHER